ncbi:MAG: large conductance mechanosensitive channel [Erysipelotrichaceae bacterium]|nr:MAG: large conductance mechanosensitive [Erysipelotrichaceae bacterium]TXT16943.1 MAG: large conductance mechanosensitive channel [Erysipelotrichaceae bacterium]
MKQFFKEFKDFASKGNIMELAIGVIIGSAFGKIVTSLVNDLIMPIVSVLTGGLNFSDIKIVLVQATETKAAVAIMAGNFIKNVVDFLIIAFSIFIMIRALTKLKRKEEAKIVVVEPVAPVENELSILKDIKVLLEKK